MAQQVVDTDKLAEAQEAADAAMAAADVAHEAATLAAAKVAELAEPTTEGQGSGGTTGRHATPEGRGMARVVTGRQLDGDGVADGYRIIRNGPEDFSVEGAFRQQDGSQRFRTANGFPFEAAARQWIKDQLAEGR